MDRTIIAFEETEQPVSREQIAKLEERFGVKLPDSFVAHYLKNNGGYHPYQYVKGVQHIFSVNMFIPMVYGPLPIEKTLEDYTKSNISFGKRIPFAFDDGGNLFLISCEENDYGTVVIAEAEFLQEDPIRYTLVSPSFDVFMDSFVEEDV